MKISTRTRYGLRALVDLASHYRGTPVIVREIAARQKISESYLEQILLSLRKAGLVESISGARGGYLLAKKPEEIRVSSIVNVLEGSLAPVACVEHRGFCENENDCPARELWLRVKKSVNGVLDSCTLRDLMKNKRVSR